MSGANYEAKTVVEYKTREGETKSRWNRVGSAFTNRDGSITVLLDALPVSGKLVLQLPREDDSPRRDRPQGRGRPPERREPPPAHDDADDGELPF